MPTIMASLILSLFFFQSPDKEKKTDRDYDGLNSPVRRVRIETEYPNRSVDPKNNARGLDKIVFYDRDGRESEEVDFNHSSAKSCAMSRRIFSYDDKGNRTETIFWGENLVKSKTDKSQSAVPPLIYKQIVKLDDSGRRSEIQEYDFSGKPYFKWLCKYDDKGRIKETVSEYSNSRRMQCEFKYNDNNLPSEQACKPVGVNSADKTTYTYEYDANRNWIKRIASTTALLPDGSSRENQIITYREIKLYSQQDESNQAEQKEIDDAIDAAQLGPCMPRIIRKSGGVLQGSAIKRGAPSYPSGAKAAGISGTVVVEVTVNEAGKVISARAISGPAELRDASIEAARKWEFQPTMLTKIPVKVIGTISFHYNL